MRRSVRVRLSVILLLSLATVAAAAEAADPLERLRSLEKIRDAAAIEAECRGLLKAGLSAEQRVHVYTALFSATEGDKRIEVLKSLPADFPEKEGVELFIAGMRDSAAYRSLDYYTLMLGRYGGKVTVDMVDRGARPLLNERRDWESGAEAIVDAALKRFPGEPKLLDILADAYCRTRRRTESLVLQRKAIENARTPELKRAMYGRLARNLHIQGKEDEVLQVSYDIIREWPDHDWAREALGGLALRSLRADGPERAAKVYQWYIATYPEGKWAEHCLLSMPGLYQLDGQYDRAVEEMQRIRPLLGERQQALMDRDQKAMPSVEGRVLDERGKPIAGAAVALARRSPLREEDGYLIVAKTRSDDQGRYEFRNLVSHTTYEFVAATKPDDPVTGLSTTYGPKGFVLEANDHKAFGVPFGRAPLKRLPDPAPPAPAFDDGVPRRHLRTFVIRDWTERPWPRSPVHYAVELPWRVKPSSLRVVDADGQPVPFQFTETGAQGWLWPRRKGVLTFFTALAAKGTVAFFLFGTTAATEPPKLGPALSVAPTERNVAEVSTGVASFRVPVGPPRELPPAMHISAAPAPILAVKGPDGLWRGKGSFQGRGQVTRIAATWLEEGPLVRRLRIQYDLDDGGSYEATLTFLAGEPYVLVHEKCSRLSGAFRFSVAPNFEPNRVALCWINKVHVEAIAREKRQRLIQMPRYVMWAPPGEGDAAGFYHESPDRNDLITCFTVHPGDWVVQSMERWRARKFGDKSRCNDVPNPGGNETIEAFEDKGDAYFSYPFFDGERDWGLAVTPKDNPGERAANLRVSVGEITLDWYKDLVLDWDEAPLDAHPRLAVSRTRLPQVARDLKTSPVLQAIAEPKRVQSFQTIYHERPRASMDFLFTGDPQRGWEARDVAPRGDTVAGIRAGKTRANIYSPVGVRGLPYQSADGYDALVNSNIYEAEAWRALRAKMMFVAYALSGGDFMAWRYHAGHRNFDFSRLDAIVAYGLCFPNHPDAKRLVDTAVNQFRESLIAFTSEVSGKWQENLGCYYLWSLRTVAAMNARLLNSRWRGYDPFEWPKYELFLRFGARTVTPDHPLSVDAVIDGLAAGQSYADLPKGRRHPGVGDHGGEDGGLVVTDGVALSGFLAARMGHKQLASDLIGAWNEGGREATSKAGIDIKGLLIGNLDPAVADKATMKLLASENLPDYGFCFRTAWDTPDESYLLFKCGTGGYRYHYSEGSFVLYAKNRPLSVDGDENIVPARHATITVGPQHGYVGNGRIERFLLHPAADYCRGVFAEPGDWQPVARSLPAAGKLPSGSSRAAVARSIVFAKNRYFAIRDDAEGETNFILPLLVQKIERRGDHFHCPGRLGLDVLVYPLGGEPAKVEIATDPLLNQQRLTMTRKDGGDHLNLIYWTEPGGKPLSVEPVGAGYRIRGPGFEDYLFLTAEPGGKFEKGEIAFEGRAGLIRLAGKKPVLLLFDGTRIRYGKSVLESPAGAPKAR